MLGRSLFTYQPAE